MNRLAATSNRVLGNVRQLRYTERTKGTLVNNRYT